MTQIYFTEIEYIERRFLGQAAYLFDKPKKKRQYIRIFLQKLTKDVSLEPFSLYRR